MRRSDRTISSVRRSCMCGSQPIRSWTIAIAARCNMRCAIACRLPRAGDLTAVWIPDEDHEAMRNPSALGRRSRRRGSTASRQARSCSRIAGLHGLFDEADHGGIEEVVILLKIEFTDSLQQQIAERGIHGKSEQGRLPVYAQPVAQHSTEVAPMAKRALILVEGHTVNGLRY